MELDSAKSIEFVIPKNQLLLKFNNSIDCKNFSKWLKEIGFNEFLKWSEANSDQDNFGPLW